MYCADWEEEEGAADNWKLGSSQLSFKFSSCKDANIMCWAWSEDCGGKPSPIPKSGDQANAQRPEAPVEALLEVDPLASGRFGGQTPPPKKN